MKIFSKAILIALSALGFVSTNSYAQMGEITGAQLLPVGRFDKANNKLELISSGAHSSFSFSGSECTVFVSLASWQNAAYLQYEVDGIYQQRIRIEKNNPSPILIPTNGNGRHTVTLYKTTEAHSGPLFIEKIMGQDVQPIAPTAGPLIEFIGNSITCGAAADPSGVPCGAGEYLDQHNAYFAYGPRVARALGADFMLSSVSGIGVYRNWNSLGPTMPQVYENTDLLNNDRKWNFNTFAPSVVSIALGTNDFSKGDGKTPRQPFSSSEFVKKYIELIKLVKTKYPAAKIILLGSPMVNGENKAVFQKALQTVKKNIDQQFSSDTPVTIFFTKEINPGGCTGHPNVQDHELIANELVPVFSSLLK